MQWVGGPSKDLGGQDASNKVAGFASQGASRTENMASGAALRNAQGGPKGKGGGGGGDTKQQLKEALEEHDAENGGGKDQTMGEPPTKS